MELPLFIKYDRRRDGPLPGNMYCCLCRLPNLHAVNTACQHRICHTCAQNLEERDDRQCHRCTQLRNAEVDVLLSNDVQERVKQLIIQRAQALFQSRFPPFLVEIIPRYAGLYIDADSCRLDVARLVKELDGVQRCLSRGSVTLHDGGGDLGRITTCL